MYNETNNKCKMKSIIEREDGVFLSDKKYFGDLNE